MARPTKCTSEVIEEFRRYLAAGNYFQTTCALVGVDEKTGYNWLNRGRDELERVSEDPRRSVRKDEAIFVEFFQTITRARAEAEAKAVMRIQQRAAADHEGDWKADAWFLEHAFPARWRDRKGLDVKADVKVASAADVAAALGVVLGEDE